MTSSCGCSNGPSSTGSATSGPVPLARRYAGDGVFAKASTVAAAPPSFAVPQPPSWQVGAAV